DQDRPVQKWIKIFKWNGFLVLQLERRKRFQRWVCGSCVIDSVEIRIQIDFVICERGLHLITPGKRINDDGSVKPQPTLRSTTSSAGKARLRRITTESGLAGRNISITSSDSATSSGVPKVMEALSKDNTPWLVSNCKGTAMT